MAEFVIDAPQASGRAFQRVNTDGLVALDNGGFALLQTDIVNTSLLGARLLVFQPEGDGFAQIAADIPLVQSSVQRLLPTVDGGMAVLRFQSGTNAGLRVTGFDDIGVEVSDGFTPGFFSAHIFDVGLFPSVPRRVLPFRETATAELELFELFFLTGVPTTRIDLSFEEFMIGVDGGMLLEFGPTFDSLVGVPLPGVVEAGRVWSLGPGDVGIKVSAGNHVVLDRIASRSIPDPLGGPSTFEQSLTILMAEPALAAGLLPRVVFADEVINARFRQAYAEVPGFGFAVFVERTDTRTSEVIDAEVLLFDFAGELAGRQTVTGAVGQNLLGFGPLSLIALNDPAEEGIRILAVWEEDESNSDTIPELVMGQVLDFTIPAGDDGRAVVAVGTSLRDYLRGYGLSDVLNGGDAADVLDGFGGDDLLQGSGGNDFVDGGLGNDQIEGGDGADILNGRAGRDVISGGRGNDLLSGEDGGDTLRGDAGADRLDGGPGNDRVEGGDGADRVLGDLGQDTLLGGAGVDTLQGGRGADSLDGGAGADILFGNQDHDTIVGGAGLDRMTGGPGADVFIFRAATDSRVGPSRDVITDFSPGADLLDLSMVAPGIVYGQAFSTSAPTIVYNASTGILRVDVNADLLADFEILLANKPALPTDDFLI